jgi:hypothetical protein
MIVEPSSHTRRRRRRTFSPLAMADASAWCGPAGGTAASTPLTILGATLVAWYRADLGVTIVQGPVVKNGTTPPAVTFSGTPSSSANTIVLTCTAAGTNTTATFSWTLNGVAQTPFTAAATVVLPGTGITATFPAGAYTNTPSADTYTSVVTVSSWADQSGNGFTATQAAALQQFAYLPTGGPNSTPVMSGNNANTTNMQAAIGALTKPSWVWMVLQFTTTTVGYVLDASTTANTLGAKQSNPVSIFINSGAGLAWGGSTNGSFQALGLTFGASGSIASNGTVKVSGTSGTTSSTGLTIGSTLPSFTSSADCLIAEVVVCSAPPAANALSAYSQARYGFG